MKKLVLIRHGKSSWKDPALTDLKRPLKKRGERNAREMAKRLENQDLGIDRMYLSPALRVTQTIETMTDETGFVQGVCEIRPELYTFNYEDLLLFVRELDDSYQCIGVAGHNPAITDLVNFLTLDDISNIPTCGVAVLDVEKGKWSQLRAGGAKLTFYDFPKNEVSVDV